MLKEHFYERHADYEYACLSAGYSGEEGQKLLDLIKAYGDVQI